MVQKTKHFSEQGLKKAKKIGKAAARLFNRKGYVEANMDDIAAEAKMSKGGIYHYFSSKDEILFFVLTNYMDIMLEDLEAEVQKIKNSSSKIQFVISRHIELYIKYSSEGKTLLHEAHCLPSKYYKKIAAKEKKYFQIASGVLSEFFGGQTKINNGRITVMTFLLFGMCNWVYSWYNPKGDITPEELSEMIWTLFLNGVNRLRPI